MPSVIRIFKGRVRKSSTTESVSATPKDTIELQNRALHAAIAAINVLDLALNKLQSAWSILPEGEEKEKLEAEKVRLAFALYDVRMTVLRLFPSCRLPSLDAICGEPAQHRM